jgi:RNA polymerase sigma-54 factor
VSITQRLDLRQSQNLVMTPQLQQAIKLLQLSSADLAAFVETELETNPMLDRDEGPPDDPREALAGDDPTRPETRAEAADSADLMTPDAMPGASEDGPLDADYSNTFDGDIAGPGAGSDIGPGASGGTDFSRRTGDDELPDLEATLATEKTLTEHLEEQMRLELDAPRDRLIGRHLIDAVDEIGRLGEPVEDIADRLGCPVEEVEAVLRRLQTLDPPGILARDLAECLRLQLEDRNRFDPAMAVLLDNLDLLARREGNKLMKLCGVDAEDLTEMVAELRALNPRPAAAFVHETVETVVPDVMVREGPDGDWLVELNQDALPKVLVNERYHSRVSGARLDKADKDFIAERFQTANWLVKSLQQRATTILKVSTEIVRQQSGFLRHGVDHLRPLILRDIAEAIEMHESTVSRVTSNKYMATPRGLFELKYFFTTAIASTSGDAHSAESVRHRIRTLIDAESPDAILSDDKLVDLLNGDGIDIARRTVAKYREAMRIPSSVRRRREKRAGL